MPPTSRGPSEDSGRQSASCSKHGTWHVGGAHGSLPVAMTLTGVCCPELVAAPGQAAPPWRSLRSEKRARGSSEQGSLILT